MVITTDTTHYIQVLQIVIVIIIVILHILITTNLNMVSTTIIKPRF